MKISISFLSPDRPDPDGNLVLSVPIVNQTRHAIYFITEKIKLKFQINTIQIENSTQLTYIPNFRIFSAIQINFINWQMFIRIIVTLVVRFIV